MVLIGKIIQTLFLIFLISCGANTDSNLGDNFTPGIEELNILKQITLTSPVSNNNTNDNPIVSISDINIGETVLLYTDSTCTTEIASEIATASTVNFNLNLTVDQTYQFYAKRENGSLESKCSTVFLTYTLDRVNPVLSITNPTAGANLISSNQNTFVVSGTCSKEDQKVDLLIDGEINFTYNDVDCNSGAFSLVADLSNLADGNYLLSVRQNSLSGLTGVSSQVNIVKDTVAPNVSLNALTNISGLNQNSYNIQGVCDGSENVILEINGNDRGTASCASNSFNTNLDLSAVSDGNLTVRIRQNDSVGNSGFSISQSINKDSTAPSLTGLSNDTQAVKTKTWAWACSESNCLYRYVVDSNPNTNPSGSYNLNTTTSISGVDGTRYLHIQVQDSFGNVSAVFHYSAVLDSTGPNNPTLIMVSPSSQFSTLDSISFSVGNITLTETLYLYNDSSCTNQIEVRTIDEANETYNFNSLAEGSYPYSVKVEDSSNRFSDCVTMIYTRDLTRPDNPLSWSMQSPLNGESAKDNTPQIYGNITNEDGSSVIIYDDVICSNQVGDTTIEAGSFLVDNISYPIDGSAIGLHEFYGKIKDQAGNESDCVNLNLSYTLEQTGLANLPKLAMVGSNSPSSVISLEDNNEIKLNGVILDADAGKSEVINFNVNQGDRLECTKACYAVTQGFGTAPWASDAYAGLKFTSFITRYGEHSPKIYVAATSANSFVEVKQNGLVVDSALVPKNTIHEFTISLTNNQPFIIESNNNIAAYFVSRSSGGGNYERDARVLTPAHTQVIGLSGHITSVENNTNVSSVLSQGSSNSEADLDISENLYPGRALKSSMSNWGLLVNADKPVSITQTADQDGINATPSLPTSMLATNYGIPRSADYVVFLSLLPGTVSIYNPDGSFNQNISLSNTAGATPNAPYIAYFSTDLPAGTTFECSVVCMGIYDDEGSGADRDETLMMGFSP